LHGQRIGYIRVSSFDQNPERQLDQVEVDKQFIDKASGKDTMRPQLPFSEGNCTDRQKSIARIRSAK
jgi:hypothetical protein